MKPEEKKLARKFHRAGHTINTAPTDSLTVLRELDRLRWNWLKRLFNK